MGKSLQVEYDALVRKAAAYGYTSVHGRTPREHMESLLRAGPWLEPDLRRLTEMVEGGVFAGSAEMAAEGVAICRRLSAELPNLPPPEKPAGSVRRRRSDFEFILRGVFPLLGVAFVVLLAIYIPKINPRPRGGRGGHAFRIGSPYASPWTNESEKSSVRKLSQSWEKPAAQASYESVQMPEYQDTGDALSGVPFFLGTGVDHHFANLKEPFDPPLNHHHRQFVYPWVDGEFRFRRIGSPLLNAVVEEVPAGARVHRADVKIILESGSAVPVPVPAPDSVVIEFEPIDGVELRFVKDPADGLRVWSDRSGPFRLRYVTATVSDYLMAPLPRVPVGPREMTPMHLPEEMREDAALVLQKIGWEPAANYAAKVRRLHAYFAGFEVAPLTPKDMRRSRYLTLALARKGTCGHRAMTFVVTANAAGIPARLVTNDVHAFAEVRLPGGGWRALEFRLLDNERRDRRTSLTSWAGVGQALGLVLFVLVGVFLGAAAVRRPAWTGLAGGAGPTRAHRRAARDKSRGLRSLLLLRIVRMSLNRLSPVLGVAEGDRRALRNALRTGPIPQPERLATVALLELEENVSPGDPMDRYRLREAYWCARRLLHWLEKGATF